MEYRKLFILDRANDNAMLANLSYESNDDQGSYPAIEWLQDRGMITNAEMPETILITGDSITGTDFWRMLSITAVFNTTTASHDLVGDLATVENGIEMALYGDGGDEFGFQVGFYLEHGSWNLVIWGTLRNRSDNTPLRFIPSRLPADANPFDLAKELARLLRDVDTAE